MTGRIGRREEIITTSRRLKKIPGDELALHLLCGYAPVIISNAWAALRYWRFEMNGKADRGRAIVVHMAAL